MNTFFAFQTIQPSKKHTNRRIDDGVRFSMNHNICVEQYAHRHSKDGIPPIDANWQFAGMQLSVRRNLTSLLCFGDDFLIHRSGRSSTST
jgi:hypothetical protein